MTTTSSFINFWYNVLRTIQHYTRNPKYLFEQFIFSTKQENMEVKTVEGDYKEVFQFKIIEKEDIPEVCQHVREYFLKTEQMNVYLGWSEESALEHDALVKIAIETDIHGLSLLIRHKLSNQIAAVNIVTDSRQPLFLTTFGEEGPKSANLKKITKIIGNLVTNTDEAFHSECPNSNFWAEIFITSVNRDFRGQGLAKELYVRMIHCCKTKNYPSIRSSFTSPIMRRIAYKLGFKELGRIYFKEAIDESTQERLFPIASDGTEEFASDGAITLLPSS